MLQRSTPNWICIGFISVDNSADETNGIHMIWSISLGSDAGKVKSENIQNGGLLYLNSSYMYVTSGGRIEVILQSRIWPTGP